MTTFGNWPLLERVTNDEFLKLLPHLSLEQYFLTQVFVPKNKWIHLLDANLQTLQINCGVCNKHFRFEDIKNHLTQYDHLMSLRSNAKQFYHPIYTYGKGDMKLARGEHAPQDVRESALREVNMQMKSFKREFTFAKHIANIAHERAHGMDEEQLIKTTLCKKIENPDDMIIVVCLPFENISKLIYSVVSGEWRTVVGYKNFTKKTTFHCKICSVYCSGIESLNSHLNGFTHRLRQLEVLALCYEDSSRVNKNCCIHFGDSFSISVKKVERVFTKTLVGNDLETWINILPEEIASKIKALNDYMPKILTCSDQDTKNKEIEHDEKLESYENLGHLGVEYVLKIIKNENDRDPKFECALCEFLGDAKRMQRHLLSYNHKKKYLDLHFPDTIKRYEVSLGHMCYKEFCVVMSEILNKVAAEIEKHHGRSLPYTVSFSDYEARRPDLIAEVYGLLHASQTRGPSFCNVFSKKDIKKLKDSAKQLAEKKIFQNIKHIIFTTAPKCKIYLNKMNHDPVVRLMEYTEKLNKNRLSKTNRSMSPTGSPVYDPIRDDFHTERLHTRVYDQRIRSRSPICERPRTPIEKALGALQSPKAIKHNIWNIYRREIAIAANEIEAVYENYRSNPESHPLYEEEWNTFWQRRKKELEREGYNHRSHNFQPEWVHYFKQRIEVLFGEELHKSKINIRQRLQIPLDAAEDCQRSNETGSQLSIDRPIKDCDGLKRYKRRRSPEFKGCESQSKRAFLKQMPKQGKEELCINESQLIVPKISDNHSNVIRVLRLITALEEHLGSLGGKVMHLLSNALQLEKNYTENNIEFEAKVLTVANCHLLETAMEKLKGILFAGLLDEKKISGFNRVIQHTANLLKYAEKMGWRQEDKVSERTNFRNSNRARIIQEQMYGQQNRNSGGCSQGDVEKALSETLMDLIKTPQASKQQIKISEQQFKSHKEEHSMLPDCPPPPNLREPYLNTNLLVDWKEQQSKSGLASFDTKLSLDQTNHSQQFHLSDLCLQSKLGQLHRSTISGGSNLYNNSFKNNNDTRTNMNMHTIKGPIMRDVMNSISGTSQFRNSQFISNVGQKNANYQGGGEGGNRNQNWLQWNQSN